MNLYVKMRYGIGGTHFVALKKKHKGEEWEEEVKLAEAA